MSAALAYVVGFGTGLAAIPLALGVVSTVLWARETGLSVTCAYCGYCTGEMGETRRLTAHARWQWHKLVTRHHTRRLNRKQQWDRGRLVKPVKR